LTRLLSQPTYEGYWQSGTTDTMYSTGTPEVSQETPQRR
jgi:hypothetical protein